MEQECKQPEVLSKLDSLQEKIWRLRDKLNPVILNLQKDVNVTPVKERSDVMRLIDNITSSVDSIIDSIDIN